MLYPLSKAFNSTRLFQSGENSAPVPRRVWSLDRSDAQKRASELHLLLAEKKPYETHLQLAKQYADEDFQKVRENARNHAEHLKEMGRRIDEDADNARKEMRRGIREYEMKRADSDSALQGQMTGRAEQFKAWRDDMENRVAARPPIHGGPPVRETAERAAQRDNARQALKDSSRRYFDEQRSLKAALAERPLPPPPLSRVSLDYLEESRAAGLAALSKQQREYEGHLEGLYDKHHQRIMDVKRKNEEFYMKIQEERAIEQANKNTAHLDRTQRFKDEHAQMMDRVKAKPKSFGGYESVPKSKRRLREEASQQGLSGTMSSSGTMGRSQEPNQRTLSPRSLGQATST